MINVLVGLLGLGLVVFVHELGHLIAARASGITVEAFSVGWGRKIWSKTWKNTEYRVGWLPLGGYCKMQGEHALTQAWQQGSSSIDVEPGDFYAAKPWKRIIVLLAGPLVNFAFAGIVLGVIAIIGYSTFSFSNRIVMVSDYFPQERGAADEAGLQTGDVITMIDDRPITTFRDLQMEVSRSARQERAVTFERDGVRAETEIVPVLDTASGAGRIGVFPWIEPVVGSVREGSPADLGGLVAGDRLLQIGDTPIEHTVQLDALLREQQGATRALTVDRAGSQLTLTIIPEHRDDGSVALGILWQAIEGRSPAFGLISGIGEGFRQAGETLVLTIQGLGLLFTGLDVNQALMGPARITYLVGEVATEGFRGGIGRGLLSFFNFLSLISVTLFFMNLLPIPALDGGQIMLTLFEMVSRRPLHPRLVYRFQVVGTVMILALLTFAVFNDILFFTRS